MAEKSQVGKVQTVLGPVSPDELGLTLTHEHLLVDASHLLEPPEYASERGRFNAPLTIELLGWLRQGNGVNREVASLVDLEVAIEEARYYQRAGGQSVVDATSKGIHRDPQALAQISRATGLNVIMGGSYYVAASHPVDMDDRTEDSIVGEIVKDVTEGVGDTGIRQGIIGEVGCTWPLAPNERKVLRASGRAQRLTGAPLIIHPGRDEMAPAEIVEVLREVDTDISRTIFSHMERTIYKPENLKSLAETGCIIEYDLFGQEHTIYPAAPNLDMPNDGRRLDWIAWLIEQGHGDQVVMAQDIDYQIYQKRGGGHGRGHILDNVVPLMRRKGFTREQIDVILVETPKRVLAFVEPVAE